MICVPLPRKHNIIFLVICVPLPRKHIPLEICVPLPGKHISLVICVLLPRTHISLVICVPLPWKHNYIPSDMCSPTLETYIISLSDANPIFSGVPQESILGPLLFTIHFNNVHTPLQSTSIITYADDTVIFTAAKDLESIQRHLSDDCNVCTPFKGYFTKIEHNINTRNNRGSLKLPKAKLEFGQKSFAFQGALVYNTLPRHLRNLNSRFLFKSNLKESFQ